MLIVVALFLVMLVPVAVLLTVADRLQRRRARVVARQIMLTDAVHAELGAVVAPVVEKHAFRPWRVIFPVGDSRLADVGRLIAIANRVFPRERTTDDVHIVFTRSTRAA